VPISVQIQPTKVPLPLWPRTDNHQKRAIKRGNIEKQQNRMAKADCSSLWISSCPLFLRRHLNRLQASPVGYRLAKGAFWSLIGTSISRVLALGSSIIVARMLGKSSFGQLGIIQSTVGMFGVFAGMALGLTVNKYVAEFRAKDRAKAGGIIILSNSLALVSGTAMAILLMIFAPWLSRHTLAAPQLARPLAISSLVLLFSAVAGTQTGALAGFEAFKEIARINFLSGLTTVPLMVGGAWLMGLNGAVWGLVGSQAIIWALSFFGVRKEARRAGVPLRQRTHAREWSLLWQFSLPAVLGSVMIIPADWLCNAMLVNQPHGFAQMGLLSAANQWYYALLFLPGVLGQASLPVFSERHGQRNISDVIRILSLSTKINAAVAAPLVVLGSLASPYIMAFYGKNFIEGWPTMVVVLVTAGLVAIQTPAAQILTAFGRMWVLSAMNFCWACCFLSLTYLLVHHGSIGLVTARMIAHVLHTGWLFAVVAALMRTRRRQDGYSLARG
jgi:O-antigen/teichoic acid export membrane protein